MCHYFQSIIHLIMNLFENSNHWAEKLAPIVTKYKNKKHPLDYKNNYQLMVMVVLSAQDSDANVNKIAPILFEIFPNMESLAGSDESRLLPYLTKIKNYETKTKWLIEIAKTIKNNENIPLTISSLTALKGIGRKSANVILRETNLPSEGIIVDLHVLRVAPRIGLIPETKDGLKAEKQLIQILPKEIWRDIGMAISFLGREICRPQPKCEECILNRYCKYYKKY